MEVAGSKYFIGSGDAVIEIDASFLVMKHSCCMATQRTMKIPSPPLEKEAGGIFK